MVITGTTQNRLNLIRRTNMETIFWTSVITFAVGYVLGLFIGHNKENFTEE